MNLYSIYFISYYQPIIYYSCIVTCGTGILAKGTVLILPPLSTISKTRTRYGGGRSFRCNGCGCLAILRRRSTSWASLSSSSGSTREMRNVRPTGCGWRPPTASDNNEIVRACIIVERWLDLYQLGTRHSWSYKIQVGFDICPGS